jgi:hypothetical protein
MGHRPSDGMAVMEAWVLAASAAAAVGILAVPRHRPRRFAEDDVGAPIAAADGHGSGGVVTRWTHRRRVAAAEWRDRRPDRRRSEPELHDLATCCDLLAVAAASGATVAAAVRAVGGTGTGPVATALGHSAAEIGRGASLEEAVAGLQRALGPAGQPLATTLLTAATSGAPPAPGLLRLADAERRRARRRVEARVRRLPVLLLLPLVGCILPAFVLLTLVPVGLSAARGAGLAAPLDRPSALPLTVPIPGDLR